MNLFVENYIRGTKSPVKVNSENLIRALTLLDWIPRNTRKLKIDVLEFVRGKRIEQ